MILAVHLHHLSPSNARRYAMQTVKCPKCGREVYVIRYGNGYLAACCGRVLYSGEKLPEDEEYRSMKKSR